MRPWPDDYQDQFWLNYPRKISKKYTLKILDRVKASGEISFEALLAATKTYAKSVSGKDMKYVAHPSTWLSKGRWDDEHAALLDIKVEIKPHQQGLDAGFVTIRQGSPEAEAWEKHRGKLIPWGPSGTWIVPTRWPPGHP